MEFDILMRVVVRVSYFALGEHTSNEIEYSRSTDVCLSQKFPVLDLLIADAFREINFS